LDVVSAMKDVFVFHAGTKKRKRVVTAGGRVLAVSALGPDLAKARARAYDAVAAIDFRGVQFRSDIALKASQTGVEA
jgi:phosphoribosylamine--glycine ligase